MDDDYFYIKISDNKYGLFYSKDNVYSYLDESSGDYVIFHDFPFLKQRGNFSYSNSRNFELSKYDLEHHTEYDSNVIAPFPLRYSNNLSIQAKLYTAATGSTKITGEIKYSIDI